MFFNNNDFAGLYPDYPIPENNGFDSNGYPLEATNGEPSAHATWASGYDYDPTLAGPSTAGIENWWLASRPECDASQYVGSTLLGSSGTGEYGFHADPPTGVNTGESNFCLSSVVNTVFDTDNYSR